MDNNTNLPKKVVGKTYEEFTRSIYDHAKPVNKKSGSSKYKNICVTMKSELCERFESRIGLIRRSTAIAYLIEEYLKRVEQEDNSSNTKDDPLANGGLI